MAWGKERSRSGTAKSEVAVPQNWVQEDHCRGVFQHGFRKVASNGRGRKDNMCIYRPQYINIQNRKAGDFAPRNVLLLQC